MLQYPIPKAHMASAIYKNNAGKIMLNSHLKNLLESIGAIEFYGSTGRWPLHMLQIAKIALILVSIYLLE